MFKGMIVGAALVGAGFAAAQVAKAVLASHEGQQIANQVIAYVDELFEKFNPAATKSE